MTKIDDYIKKGKLKVTKISDEMIIKELEVGGRRQSNAVSRHSIKKPPPYGQRIGLINIYCIALEITGTVDDG